MIAGNRHCRGPFASGDRVQLTDPRGRHNTIQLRTGGTFQSHHGYFRHDDLIGQSEGSVITNTEGVQYLALRPLLSDYVMSMPRGAAVVYPKDAAQIVTMADVFPGATVVEAGVGSGALTLSLLRAVGDGRLVSIERRADFAEIARGNVREFFGSEPDSWELLVGDFADVVGEVCPPGSVDRVILDMLAPWENIAAAALALAAGGVFCAYVATTTQLSRLAEALRADGRWAEPSAFETLVRGWHLEGLSVRPDHRMQAHTGFLLIVRRLADGVTPPMRKRRPAPGAYGDDFAAGDDLADWTAEELGERPVSDKKIRKILRGFSPSPAS